MVAYRLLVSSGEKKTKGRLVVVTKRPHAPFCCSSARWRLRTRAGRRRIPGSGAARRHQDSDADQDDDSDDDPRLRHVQQIGAKRESNNQDEKSDEVRREGGHGKGVRGQVLSARGIRRNGRYMLHSKPFRYFFAVPA